MFTVFALSGITQKYTLQQLLKWHRSFGGGSRIPCEVPLKQLPPSILLCARRSGETLKIDMAKFHQKNVEAVQPLLRPDNRNEHVISASINFNQILSHREDLIEFNRRENLKTLTRSPVLLMRI